MKRSFLALTAVLVAFGCTEAPTEPELGPQFSMAPVVFTVTDSFEDFNPCTGADHTNFIEITFKEHLFESGQNFHINGRAQIDVTTSDGFSGSAVEHFTLNENNAFNVTNVVNVNLSNASRQRIKIRIVFHITESDAGVPRVFVDNFSSTCVGKPAG